MYPRSKTTPFDEVPRHSITTECAYPEVPKICKARQLWSERTQLLRDYELPKLVDHDGAGKHVLNISNIQRHPSYKRMQRAEGAFEYVRESETRISLQEDHGRLFVKLTVLANVWQQRSADESAGVYASGRRLEVRYDTPEDLKREDRCRFGVFSCRYSRALEEGLRMSLLGHNTRRMPERPGI